MAANTTKTVATRQRFVDEAMRLFQEVGYEQTTMARIAAAADSSRANLYLYFSGKPQIVVERMQELDPHVEGLFEELNHLKAYTPEAMTEWLMGARALWIRYATEFSALVQAMTSDSEVLTAWELTWERVPESQTVLYRDCRDDDERLDREAHLITLMLSLERNFYFLYVRGNRSREDRIIASLARQWSQLFNPAAGTR